MNEEKNEENNEINEINENEKINEFKKVFYFVDKNNDGKINIKEVEYGLGILGKILKKKEIEQIITENNEEKFYDLDKFIELCNKNINYDKIEENLISSFKIFEEEKKPGFISKKNFIYILKLYNEKISDKDIKDIIKEANPDKEGFINIEEFAKEMLIK